jgi:predicted DNA-binding antitoxin AbrB/MazE fold protein
MARQKTIVAVYEGGRFTPVEPVSDLAEQARVSLCMDTEHTLEERIAESARRARESVEGLTDAQRRVIEDAALDQEHVFDRSH